MPFCYRVFLQTNRVRFGFCRAPDLLIWAIRFVSELGDSTDMVPCGIASPANSK